MKKLHLRYTTFPAFLYIGSCIFLGEKEPGKRRIGEGEVVSETRPSSFRYFTSSSAIAHFGDVQALTVDKFGALRDPEDERPHVFRRVHPPADSLSGSFPPEREFVEGDKQSHGSAEVKVSSSTWSQYTAADRKIQGLSNLGAGSDPSSHSSVPISCTLHERRSASEGLTLQELRSLPSQDEPNSHGEFELLQNEVAAGVGASSEQARNDSEPVVNAAAAAAAAGSLPTALSKHAIDHCNRTSPGLHFTNIDGSVAAATHRLAAGGPGSSSRSPRLNSNDFARLARNMGSSSSDDDDARRYSSEAADDQFPVRINYRFASPSLETALLQRMEERQRLQDEAGGEERVCGHVISPEDLIWGSVKHYCGMVLDRETRALLGTAILFMPPDHQQGGASGGMQVHPNVQQPQPQPQAQAQAGLPAASVRDRSAWVTSVKVVEGRTEVLIKNSKGGLHVAHLLLTSTTLGLALFGVHVLQATFALAFLSRVAGPARLPHRLFVDVDRRDRVYVFAYEEPWESEAGTIADVRVRPGRIVDAGRHEIVEIDFRAGRLGGSITTPAGFRGGLVVRADGHFAGVVTGEILGRHPTNIDFSPAFIVYSLLDDL